MQSLQAPFSNCYGFLTLFLFFQSELIHSPVSLEFFKPVFFLVKLRVIHKPSAEKVSMFREFNKFL